MTIDIPEGYEALGLALGQAVAQAACGKGADRHAESGEKFSDQLIMSIPKRLGLGGECFCLGQAAKKIFESRRLPQARARAELLGAINYLAAAWCLLGGRESVFAPEDADAPRTKDELVCRIREVNPAVYPPEDVDASRFQTGELVEFRPRDGKWRPAAFERMDGNFAVVVSRNEKFRVPACDVRPAEKS